MDKNRTYVDFHVIQTVPPSCVNRDDTGSPKTAMYGGVQRARVSSQSWKRAIREMFKQNFDESELGTRTKKIVDMVGECILEKDPSITADEAQGKAEKVVEATGIKLKDSEAEALFFMSAKQAENLAQLALDGEYSKKDAQLALKKGTGVDIALFGRMVADVPSLNTDASSQVAHAISTHRVDNEYDYFTALDDRAPEDNVGAAMIDTVEYNSSTLYRYATVAAHELVCQLDGSREATAAVVREFAKAFITSMPTGKQNTFANRTLPDAVLVSIRKDQPINLVGAFEEPVHSNQSSGHVAESKKKLVDYWLKVNSDYCDKPLFSWAVGDGLSGVGERVTLNELLHEIETELSSCKG